MGDVDNLRAQVLEQGRALERLQQAAAQAEERHTSYHTELLETMASRMKNSQESEAQAKSGGEKGLPTNDTAERDAVSPSLERSGGGNGSRDEDSVAAEAGPSGGQFGGRGQE